MYIVDMGHRYAVASVCAYTFILAWHASYVDFIKLARFLQHWITAILLNDDPVHVNSTVSVHR